MHSWPPAAGCRSTATPAHHPAPPRAPLRTLPVGAEDGGPLGLPHLLHPHPEGLKVGEVGSDDGLCSGGKAGADGGRWWVGWLGWYCWHQAHAGAAAGGAGAPRPPAPSSGARSRHLQLARLALPGAAPEWSARQAGRRPRAPEYPTTAVWPRRAVHRFSAMMASLLAPITTWGQGRGGFQLRLEVRTQYGGTGQQVRWVGAQEAKQRQGRWGRQGVACGRQQLPSRGSRGGSKRAARPSGRHKQGGQATPASRRPHPGPAHLHRQLAAVRIVQHATLEGQRFAVRGAVALQREGAGEAPQYWQSARCLHPAPASDRHASPPCRANQWLRPLHAPRVAPTAEPWRAPPPGARATAAHAQRGSHPPHAQRSLALHPAQPLGILPAPSAATRRAACQSTH